MAQSILSPSLGVQASVAAAAAADQAGAEIANLDAPRDMAAAEQLLASIWSAPPHRPPVSAELLRALSHTGNYVAGAGWVGGYLEARRIHDVCAAHGVPVWCGGMLESGLGRAANVALASLPNFSIPGDTSASERYWETDLTPPFVLEDGHLPVPSGPGLGVAPDPAVLEAVTTSVERITWAG